MQEINGLLQEHTFAKVLGVVVGIFIISLTQHGVTTFLKSKCNEVMTSILWLLYCFLVASMCIMTFINLIK